MKTLGKIATITGLIIGLSAGVHALANAASIADTPLPSLLGATSSTKHLYSITGVRSLGNITTSFHCTSTEKTGGKNIVWGLELFDNTFLENDVSVGEGVMTLLPGQTGIISVINTVTFVGDVDLPGINVFKGAARILADSTKLTCTALLLDPFSDPPDFITPLPVIKKLNQKGQ